VEAPCASTPALHGWELRCTERQAIRRGGGRPGHRPAGPSDRLGCPFRSPGRRTNDPIDNTARWGPEARFVVGLEAVEVAYGNAGGDGTVMASRNRAPISRAPRSARAGSGPRLGSGARARSDRQRASMRCVAAVSVPVPVRVPVPVPVNESAGGPAKHRPAGKPGRGGAPGAGPRVLSCGTSGVGPRAVRRRCSPRNASSALRAAPQGLRRAPPAGLGGGPSIRVGRWPASR